MPKLRRRVSDGWYYIRTYAHDGDDGHNGTGKSTPPGWMSGQERMIDDDADVPARLFRYLRGARG